MKAAAVLFRLNSYKSYLSSTVAVLALLISISVSAAEQSPLIPLSESQLAPKQDLQLEQVNSVTGDKKSFSLADFKGSPVLLDFWASWCGPCRESFPWMNSMQEKYKDQGLKIVAINLDEEPELAKEFLDDIPADFIVLQDSEAVMPEEFGVMGMPTSYLLDKNGYIRAQHIGFRSSKKADYENAIQALLAE